MRRRSGQAYLVLNVSFPVPLLFRNVYVRAGRARGPLLAIASQLGVY